MALVKILPSFHGKECSLMFPIWSSVAYIDFICLLIILCKDAVSQEEETRREDERVITLLSTWDMAKAWDLIVI